MLNRFVCSTLNIGRFARIRLIKHTTVLRFRALQKRYYATVVPNDNVRSPTNLELIIKDIKRSVKNKSQLSNDDLQSILMKLKTQKCDSEQALEILRCCSFARLDENLTNIVINIWNELKKRNNDFQTKHYNYLMQCLRNRGDLKGVQKIFDEMIENKIQADALSYQCLLEVYCKAGEMDRAIEVLGLMDKANLYINESSFNNLVQCHIICGNLDGAYETIENLKASGYKVNFYTMETLLNYYAKSGDLENIEKTFELFSTEDSKLLNHCVLKVMCEMVANGYAEKIDKLFSCLKPTKELKQPLQNAISHAVEHNHSSVVPKVLQLVDGGSKKMVKHLIQEMVRCSTPEQEFNETIANIESMSITIENSFDCFKPALEGSSEEVIRKLFDHIKSHSIELSENEFKKLIELAAKKGSTEVLNVVEMMCKDFNIQPQISFVCDHILPALNAKENPNDASEKLQTTRIGKRVIVLAIITNCLNNGDIQTACEFAQNNKTFYGIDLIRLPLVNTLKTTKDVKKFVSFVLIINDSFRFMKHYYQDKTLTEAEIAVKQKAFVSETLALAISNHCDNKQIILHLLKSFADEGLNITTETAANIQRSLQVDEETEIGNLLKKLSSQQAKSQKQLNETEKLEFQEHIQRGNLDQIKSLLGGGERILSNSNYAKLIELYTQHSDLEKAMNLLEKAHVNNPEFKLDSEKVAKLVSLMCENGREFSEVEEVLIKNAQTENNPRIFVFEKLLERLATSGYVKLVEQLFDALLKYNYVDATVQLAGPLVLAFIKNGTFTEAVDKYEYLAKTFKFVSLTKVLFIELIERKEIDLLQRAFDIYKEIHGIEAAHAELAFAFVRCGQEHKARVVLKNKNSKNLSRYILLECKQYVTYGRLDAAKTLLNVTKGLHCNRHMIYQAILEIYEKKKQANEALKLWHEYTSDKEIKPRRQFETNLIQLLTANNMEIPSELQDKYQNNTKREFKSAKSGTQN